MYLWCDHATAQLTQEIVCIVATIGPINQIDRRIDWPVAFPLKALVCKSYVIRIFCYLQLEILIRRYFYDIDDL